jgi:hypothetical protein
LLDFCLQSRARACHSMLGPRLAKLSWCTAIHARPGLQAKPVAAKPLLSSSSGRFAPTSLRRSPSTRAGTLQAPAGELQDVGEAQRGVDAAEGQAEDATLAPTNHSSPAGFTRRALLPLRSLAYRPRSRASASVSRRSRPCARACSSSALHRLPNPSSSRSSLSLSGRDALILLTVSKYFFLLSDCGLQLL